MKHWLSNIACVAAALMLSMSLPACLFDTRPSEPPDDTTEDYADLTVPTGVFDALSRSLSSLTDANYQRALSQSFVFSPTQQDSLDQTFAGTTVYEGWNNPVELQVFQLMLSDAKTIDFDYASSILINKTTFVRFRVAYDLAIVNTAAPTDTSFYSGVAQWDVRNEGGVWRLTFWDEVENVPGFSSWGFLRGILRLRLS